MNDRRLSRPSGDTTKRLGWLKALFETRSRWLSRMMAADVANTRGDGSPSE